MYWLLLILRELRRLFSNKTFKMGFTIAILFFAVTSFMAWLPSSKADASTRIDVNMTLTTGYYGQFNGRGYDYHDVIHNEYYLYDIDSAYDMFYSYEVHQDNSLSYYTICYFPVTAQVKYYIGNGYTGSGNVLLLISDTPPREGVSAAYFMNITGAGNYEVVAPTDGYMIIYFTGYNGYANPMTCYYMYDSEVTQQDIETSTNTTTNTIITESQETRNTITDSNVDNTIVDMLPEDTFTNPYEGNVDSIFTKIYNTFTNNNPIGLNITIPFTNKTFAINRNTLYGGVNTPFISSVIKNLISMFWYYVFGRFVILDVLTIIEKIKNGKIDNIVESNVKEDML